LKHHVENLRSLQNDIAMKKAKKERAHAYRKKKAQLHESHRRMIMESKKSSKPQIDDDDDEDGPETADLVTSIKKLVDLEARIRALEKKADEQRRLEKKKMSTTSSIGMLRFRKKRIEATLNGPARTMHSVTTQQTANAKRREDEGIKSDEINKWLQQKQKNLSQQKSSRKRQLKLQRIQKKKNYRQSARSVASNVSQMKKDFAKRRGSRKSRTPKLPLINSSRKNRAW